ncbi:MAG: hypothetical protein U9N73_06245, partial [Candidatus Auribacterota bacterium]|nr:hypothetical protein [Candidatus Auribacterota bacterium]
MKKGSLYLRLTLIGLMLCLPAIAAAVSLEIIYKGEQTVDMRIYNQVSHDRQKFVLKRGSSEINDWVFQSEPGPDDLYYSDVYSTPPFSSHTYTILSYWSTNGTDWLDDGTDIKNVDTAIMYGTLHNDIDWQILLNRDAVYWYTPSTEYTVSFVNVVDGDLGIYDTTVQLKASGYTPRLKATGPGTITAEGVAFTSTTSDGGRVELMQQRDLSVESIKECAFQSVDLWIDKCVGVVVKDSTFNDCQVVSGSNFTGTTFNNCTGSFDLSIGGDGEIVRDCSGILELYIGGANHSILRNELRNMEARGGSCTIQDNTFSSNAYNWIRFDLSGDSNHVLENTLDHREADNGYPMIRILGDSNIVEKNVITEQVAGAGAWNWGIHIQGGDNNTVQL